MGKTTLLRIVTGILAPDRGTVMVDGIGPTDNWREYHRRIGFLSAGDRGLYARVTVQGTWSTGLRWRLSLGASVGGAWRRHWRRSI